MPNRVLLAVLLLVGCGAPKAVVEPIDVFTPDTIAAGPALFTRATVHGADVAVELVGRQLGPVLGYAFRFRATGAAPSGEAVVERALGDDALYLSKGTDGALAFAGVRKGPEAGERSVDVETVLARVQLKLQGHQGELGLFDTSVRRANGEGVVVAVGGGSIGAAR